MDTDVSILRSLRGPGLVEGLLELVMGKTRLLEVMQVGITSHCPGRCGYCPRTVSGAGWKLEQMGAGVFARLWPLLRESRRVHLQGWGEPLMHPLFFEFVECARKAGARVSTTTCGLMMNEDIAEKLVASGVDVVAFSLTGVSEEGNRARGGVSFDKVKKAVEVLQRVREKRQGVHLEVHLAYLMLASQTKEVLGLPRLMQDWGVHAAVVSTLDYVAAPEWEKELVKPGDEQAKKVLELAAKEAHSLGKELYYALPGTRALAMCRENAGSTLYAGANGEIAPCVYSLVPGEGIKSRVFGNVQQEDGVEIWNRQEYVRFRESLANPGQDEICFGCSKRFEEAGQ